MRVMGIAGGSARSAWSVFGIIRKYWYWIILFLILLPNIMSSLQVANETNNPTYPFFDLATRIFIADQALGRDVELLQTDPKQLVGLDKPSEGAWETFKYYWYFWWKACYSIISNIWLIFFPLVIIYKAIRGRNTSEPVKNWVNAIKYFLIYLFVTNAVVVVYGLAVGNTFIDIPTGMNEFTAYYHIFLELLPFHGLWSLIQYLITSAVNA